MAGGVQLLSGVLFQWLLLDGRALLFLSGSVQPWPRNTPLPTSTTRARHPACCCRVLDSALETIIIQLNNKQMPARLESIDNGTRPGRRGDTEMLKP